MKTKEKKEILEVVESEGFDYTFTSYGDFEEIKDEKFHKLRKAFLDARKNLADYIGYKEG